jgi:hypothetical protein
VTTPPTFDLTPFLGRDEDEYFGRKPMSEGEEGKERPRDRRELRDQVAARERQPLSCAGSSTRSPRAA